MELRKSICDAVDVLTTAFKYKMEEGEREKLIMAWHLGLDDIEDHVIVKETPNVIKNNKFMPVPYDFRGECIKPPPLELYTHKEIENTKTPEEIELTSKARKSFFDKFAEKGPEDE